MNLTIEELLESHKDCSGEIEYSEQSEPYNGYEYYACATCKRSWAWHHDMKGPVEQ